MGFTSIFESTRDGIGTTHLKLNKVEKDTKKKEIRLLSKINDNETIKILRYKNIPEKVNLWMYTSKYCYKQYPISNLINMAKKYKKLVNFLYKKSKKIINKHVTNPGEVCSSLVCKIYKDIGINLFHKNCKNITPSDFDNTNIFEDKSKELICYEDKTIKNNTIMLKNYTMFEETDIKQFTKLSALIKKI